MAMMTHEDWGPLATPGDAHREWHLNSGVPMGQPGCPQDACHPVDDYEGDPPTVKCGNKAAHGGEPGYHYTAAGVRECYASTGRFTGQPQPVRPAPPAPMPEITVEDAVAKMRASLAAKEAEEQAAKRARYAAWRSIPVGTGDYANYALERDGAVVLYQIQRPSKGDHRGKTFVKRHSGDGLVKMSWVESGEVMDLIAINPLAAAVLYGQTAKKCAICHRQLTDDKTKGPDGLTSLQRGIGPKCMTKI